MQIIKDLQQMSQFSQQAKIEGKKVGFVPTMGCLHNGHLSLVEAACEKAETVVVSIFINPFQFGPGEDFHRYPRNLAQDKKRLKDFEVSAIFCPNASEMYPTGHKTFVEVLGLSESMCGRSRPHHFRGVCTVVAKLFNLVSPDYAFFGEKDYQQLVIIKKMTKELNLPTEIISLPTVREFDGLALSSRNKYLTKAQRASSPLLCRALTLAKKEIEAGGAKPATILLHMRSLLAQRPEVKIDYITIADPETLSEVKIIKGNVLVALAAYLGQTRLIDNLICKPK